MLCYLFVVSLFIARHCCACAHLHMGCPGSEQVMHGFTDRFNSTGQLIHSRTELHDLQDCRPNLSNYTVSHYDLPLVSRQCLRYSVIEKLDEPCTHIDVLDSFIQTRGGVICVYIKDSWCHNNKEERGLLLVIDHNINCSPPITRSLSPANQ